MCVCVCVFVCDCVGVCGCDCVGVEGSVWVEQPSLLPQSMYMHVCQGRRVCVCVWGGCDHVGVGVIAWVKKGCVWV